MKSALVFVFAAGLQVLNASAQVNAGTAPAGTIWTYVMVFTSAALTATEGANQTKLRGVGAPHRLVGGGPIFQDVIVATHVRPCKDGEGGTPGEMCTEMVIQKRLIR